jgi:cytochrome c-type biogenesis protein CcmH
VSWLVAIALAVACFAAFALLFRLPQKAWAIVLFALALGLAGYGLQASPGLPGAPTQATPAEKGEGEQIVELRKAMVGDEQRSHNPLTITADAMMRAGEFDNAASLLRGAVHTDPHDGEAWLGLGNALAFQADGLLTPAATLAYDNAARDLPESAGPAFFVGLGLIRQGKLIEAHKLWSATLAALPPDAAGRDLLAGRFVQLDQLMRRIAQGAESPGQ